MNQPDVRPRRSHAGHVYGAACSHLGIPDTSHWWEDRMVWISPDLWEARQYHTR